MTEKPQNTSSRRVRAEDWPEDPPLEVLLVPDDAVPRGHQWIYLANTPQSRALAALLGLPEPPEEFIGEVTTLMVAHSLDADRRMLALVDLIAQIRYAAPRLVQLILLDEPPGSPSSPEGGG
jgi:hypothetical protein